MKTFKEFLEEAYKLPGEKIVFRSAYHGTSVPNARSIQQHGFKPGTRFYQDKPLPSGERIYVTTNKKNAKNYAQQAGPEKYGSETQAGQFDNRRSPIGSPQVTMNRNAPTPTGGPQIKDVGLLGKVINYVTRRNKPEILKLKVADRRGDGKNPMVSSNSTQPDEYTISTTQADTALRNAQALERLKRGTIRNPSGSKRSFVGSEVKVPLTVPR
jgi:hypothetical protein